METPEEKNETNLPENVEKTRLDIQIDNLTKLANDPDHDPDQHTSPLKEVLIDDSIVKEEISLVEFKEGDIYNLCSFHSIKNDLYIFERGGMLFATKKHASITKALNKISFGNDSIDIECIGQEKFRITKN